MNEDDMGANEPLAGDELEQVMERYARVRLSPTPAETRRARAAVMEQAWRAHLDTQGAVPAAIASSTAARAGRSGRRHPFEGWGVRRLGVTFAAAVLAGLLVGSTAFAASRAGGPLYGARLALENVTMPATGAARLEAELASAQARLAEVVDASSRGDEQALDAALTAYDATVDALGGETGADAQRALEAVQQHRAVLVRVLANAPDAATTGLRRAIANSDLLIARLTGTPGNDGNGNGDGNGAAGSPAPETTPRAGKTPAPAHTPKANPTSKPKPPATPRPTPKARPTTQPQAEPTPVPTPKAHPTPKPKPSPANARTPQP